MSDGPSTRDRRITKAGFRPCSRCPSRSQAPLCLCTLRPVSNRPEGTFARLRYLLGGDRPSQTTRQAVSPAPIQGPGLEPQTNQGGIPLAAPPRLAAWLHSLPPILYRLAQDSLPSCSEGSRGLSVPPRVEGIFTLTLISRGPRLRQCGSRYAFRAGRNLPDKEFRYLRTVIVTAAVYRGFGSGLHPAKSGTDPSP